MGDASAIALSGVRANERRIEVAATNIANSGSRDAKAKELKQSSDNGGVRTEVVDRNPPQITVEGDNGPEQRPNVDVAQEVVNAQVATYNIEANLKVIKAQDKVVKALLDIQA